MALWILLVGKRAPRKGWLVYRYRRPEPWVFDLRATARRKGSIKDAESVKINLQENYGGGDRGWAKEHEWED